MLTGLPMLYKFKKEPKHEKDILLISGATVTSSAMKDSLDQMIEDLEDLILLK